MNKETDLFEDEEVIRGETYPTSPLAALIEKEKAGKVCKSNLFEERSWYLLSSFNLIE